MFFPPPCSTVSKAPAATPQVEAPEAKAAGVVQTLPDQHAQALPDAQPAPTAPAQTALVPAVPKQPPAPNTLSTAVDAAMDKVKLDAEQATSTSHRAEYMAFLRAGRNPHKLPVALRATFASADSRQDLFRVWLQHGKDFSQCQVEFQRRNSQQQRATNKTGAMSRTQLLLDPRYTEKDVDALIARRTAEGAYTCDPNFPDRVDLRQYHVHLETTGEDLRLRENSQSITARATVSAEEALSMADAGCDFGADTAPTLGEFQGTLPVPTATPGGAAEPKAKGKARGKAKAKPKAAAASGADTGEGGDPPDVPPTPLEKAKKLATKVFLGQWYFNVAFNTCGTWLTKSKPVFKINF